MTARLYIIQSEDGGIPDTPEIYVDKVTADTAYTNAWRELYRIDLESDEVDDIEVELDKIMAEDFDSEWTSHGGVRYWVEDIPGIQLVNS